MKTLMKTILWLVGTVLLLMAAVSVAVLFFFDPNEYKGDIETLVSKQTGRDFRIEGELGLSVLPCCAIEVGQTHLSNPRGFAKDDFDDAADEDFLSFRSAAVSIEVLPLLLEQQIKVGEVTLDGLQVTMYTRQDGKVNWAFDLPAADTEPQPAAANDDGSVALPDLSIAGLSYTGGTMRWIDETADTDILISDMNAKTGPVELGAPFDLAAGFAISGLAESIDGEFSLQARPLVDPEAGSVALDNSELSLILTGDGLPGGSAELRFNSDKVRAGTGATSLLADGVTFTVVSGPVELQMTASGTVTSAGPDFSGRIQSNEFSPRQLMDAIGAEFATPDPDVLATTSLNGEWMFRSDKFALTNLNAVVDDTNLNGWLRLDSIERQVIRTEMQIDSIDLDRYIASGIEDDTGTGAAAGARESEPLPVEPLRTLDMQGKLGIGELKFADARMQDASMTVVAKDGRIRINPLQATLYSGQLNGDMQLDVRGAKPKLAVRQTINGVQVGDLLRDTSDVENIFGLFEAGLTAQAEGDTVDELIAGLNGDLSFDLNDGVYKGRDIWYELRSQKAKLQGDPPPPAPEDPKTDITEMLGRGVITDGVLDVGELLVQLPFLRVNGLGQADLNNETVDYQLNAKVIGTPEFGDGENLEELRGLTLPVKVQGDMYDPTITFDLTAVIAGLAAKKLQDRLLKKYGGVEEPAATDTTTETAPDDGTQLAPPEEEKSDRDKRKELLRDSIRDLF